MFRQSNGSSVSFPIHSCTQTLDSPDLRGQLGLDSTDLSDKSASRSSQVSSDFSIFDFTSGENVEDSRAPLRRLKSSFIRPATSHGHTHGGYSTLSFEPKQLHPTSIVSPIDAIVMPTSEVQTLQPSFGTPLTQQTKPSLLSRPPTVRGRRNLIFIQPGDDDSANECQAPYSRSPSNTSILRLPRPKTTPNLPTTRDSSSQAMRQHFVEVKRMRKMTQVFGQELPPQLIQVDNRGTAERSRSRADSTASSTSGCVPSVPTCEGCTNVLEDTPSVARRGTDFQERRRQITKLSQFFGVNHADLAPVVTTKPKHCRTISSDLSVSSESREPTKVGIKMISRKRFGFGESMREVELGDAINKLRCLKAN